MNRDIYKLIIEFQKNEITEYKIYSMLAEKSRRKNKKILARIADDGYLPAILRKRKGTTPTYAIIAMSAIASILILIGGLRLILEFGSITFMFISLLMAVANFKIRHLTNSSTLMGIVTIVGLVIGTILIIWYEYQTRPEQMLFIVAIYIILSICAWGYARIAEK